jgi:aconitase B
MRRDQLEHAIRTACQIIGRPEVIVVGSQSILGTFREDELPADATMWFSIDGVDMDTAAFPEGCGTDW